MKDGSDRVVVVGGGLAGVAAAWGLSVAGAAVTLLERRPFLGGRAFSFRDPDTGAEIDNGQHVLVGACTRLRALLDAIGAPRSAFRPQARFDVPVIDARGERARLRAGRAPAPLHLVGAIGRYAHLSMPDRWSVTRDAWALAGRAGDPGGEDDSLGEWLARRGTSDSAIERFWEPLVRPALNVPARDANLPLAAQFVRLALWSRGGGAIWVPTVGLSGAIGDPARAALVGAGVAVRTGERVTRVVASGRRAVGVGLSDGTTVKADAVVTALPPEALGRLETPPFSGGGDFSELGSSPIVNVYLWYDRDVAYFPFAASLDPDLQWMFDRRRLLGEAAGGPCLGVSLSAADAMVALDREEIIARTDAAVERALPARRKATLVRAAVVKEPRATFRAGPGVNRARPGSDTEVAGWFLAGDWTDTGWPATMEGAVRSGEAAAARVSGFLRAGRLERAASS